jgi:hypothetical protein
MFGGGTPAATPAAQIGVSGQVISPPYWYFLPIYQGENLDHRIYHRLILLRQRNVSAILPAQ